jgi:hypothetical protein
MRGEALAAIGNRLSDSAAIDDDQNSAAQTSIGGSAVRNLSHTRFSQPRVSQYAEYTVLTDVQTHQIHLALLRALISSKTVLSIVENHHFQQLIHLLRPGYVLPSRGVLTNNHLVKFYSEALTSRGKRLLVDTVFTMLWDGWTDCSGNSIYGLTLLFDYDQSEIIDIVKMNDVRHTAVNQMLEIESRFEQSSVPIGHVKVFVTDSPNVMLKLRRDMCAKYKHMIGLPCALHVLNTMCKDMCQVSFAKQNIQSMCRIVNFFTGSHIWFEHSKVSLFSFYLFLFYCCLKVCNTLLF